MDLPSFYQNALFFILMFMLADSVWHAQRKNKNHYHQLLRDVYLGGVKRYAIAFFILVATIVTAIEVMDRAPDVLKLGWLNIVMDSAANPAVAPLHNAMSDHNTNGFTILLAVCFYLLFMLAVPLISQREERWFRKDHIHIGTIILMSFLFGFMHCLIGIPIILGAVLALPGFLFALCYRNTYIRVLETTQNPQQSVEEALRASTVIHSLYNGFAVTIIVFAVIYMAIQ